VVKSPVPLSPEADVNNLTITHMFDVKEYKRGFYLQNKKKYSKDAKERYLQNRDKILVRRRESAKLETPEKREKRLAFHKNYNKAHSGLRRIQFQTDEYKFKMYSFAAKRRDYQFNLSLEEFTKIFHGDCDYCGKEDARGIDRVENAIGYTKENSVSCCEMCNKMKWKWDKAQFLIQISKIYNFNKPQWQQHKI
jgi:hypothetical protein